MATEALDLPRSKENRSPRAAAVLETLALLRIQVRVRHWRRQQARRRLLGMVLAETSDPRLVEDAGFGRPAPGLLDLWMTALLQHRR